MSGNYTPAGAGDAGPAGAISGGISVDFRRRNVPVLAHPMDNLIFVEAIPAKALTRGGLVLPETQQDAWESPLCKVIEAGPGCKKLFCVTGKEPRTIQAGDILIVQNSTPCGKLRYDGWEWLVLNEEQVSGVLDPLLIGD